MNRTYQHTALAIAIFVGIITIFLTTNRQWFFDGDDWGLVLKGAQCKSLKDFGDYFVHGKISDLALPIMAEKPTLLENPNNVFFSTLYRPIPLVFHFIQYHLFGLNAYAYFIFIIVLHAAIASLLFLLLCWYVRWLLAFCCALLFAFHPTLYGWVGKIDTLQSHINLLAGIGFVLLLYKSLQRKNLALYLASCLLFLFCLLTRETFIIFPLILFAWMFALSKHATCEYLVPLKNKLFFLSGFCATAAFYLLLRGIAYPLLSASAHTANMSFLDLVIRTCLPNAQSMMQFFYNTFWLQWFPWKAYAYFKNNDLLTFYKCTKALILFLFIACFITNTKKIIITMLLLSALFLWWPLACGSGIRLMYESVPFCIAAIAFTINFSTFFNYQLFRFMIFALFVPLIYFNASAVIGRMHHIMYEPRKINAAIQNLTQSSAHSLSNKPLLFINSTTHSNSTGILQALHLLKISTTLPQYFCREIVIKTSNNISDVNKIFRAEKHENRIRIVSLDPESAWFEAAKPEGPIGLTTQVTTNQKDGNNHIFDITLTMDIDYFHPDFTIIAWFFEQEKFVILN